MKKTAYFLTFVSLMIGAFPLSAKPYVEVYCQRWCHLIQANNKDAVRNKELAEKLFNHGVTLAKRHEKKKAKHYLNAAKIVKQIADLNKVIADSYKDEVRGPINAQKAMREIPKLEVKFLDITGKELKRSWMTFEEMQKMRKGGFLPRPEACKNGALPLLQSQWLPLDKWIKRYPAAAKKMAAYQKKMRAAKKAKAHSRSVRKKSRESKQ